MCIALCCVQAGKFKLALKYYNKITDLLKDEESAKNDNAEKRKALLLAAHLNVAMCTIKLHEDLEAVHSCDEALKLDPHNEKGLFRRGMVSLEFLKLEATHKSSPNQGRGPVKTT